MRSIFTAQIDRLLGEVVCGNVQIAGAAVRVPSSLYGQLVTRLLEHEHASIESFLTYRCGARLLKIYLEARPDVMLRVNNVDYELSSNRAVNFLSRLNQFKLLPEDVRSETADRIADITISWVDCSAFHDDDVRSLLTNDEYGLLRDRFENEIVENIDTVIRNWESEWSVSDPYQHMLTLAENLGYFAPSLNSGAATPSSVSRAIKKIEERASELSYEDEESHSRSQPPSITRPIQTAMDQIFDDVDE